MSKRGFRSIFWFIAVVLIALVALLLLIPDFLQRWLWMRQLGYQAIFWRIWLIKWSMAVAAFVCVFVYLAVNLGLVRDFPPAQGKTVVKRVGEFHAGNLPEMSRGVWIFSYLFMSVFIALIFASAFYPKWDTYLRFRLGADTGTFDPIYHADIGFYLFRLPFYKLVQDSLVILTFITALLIAGVYVWAGTFQFATTGRAGVDRRTVGHLSVLVALFFGVWAWGFYLDRYELMYSTQGVVYGVGYTAYHVTRICLWIMLWATIVLAAATLINIFVRKFLALVVIVACYFLLYIIILILLPAAVQKYWVEPSELELETPFLKHNRSTLPDRRFNSTGLKRNDIPH